MDNGVVDNVTNFFSKPMYLQMLRRVESEINSFKAIEHIDLMTTSNLLIPSALRKEIHSTLYAGENEYNKICTSINLDLFFEDIEHIVTIEIRRYHEDYNNIEPLQMDWEATKSDGKFSSILEAHMYIDSDVINDIITYLDKLYEIGFRIVKNIRIRNNVKRFILNKENIIVIIAIDYDALSEYAEIVMLENI